MPIKISFQQFWSSLSKIATHAGITLLALGLAFSLPHAASYVLFDWWPKVRDDAQMLVATEIAFAGVLLLLLNFGKLAWRYRKAAHAGAIASLVCAREPESAGADELLRTLPWKRDLTVMAVTGYDTFAAPDSTLGEPLAQCYEIRVMLLNPYGDAAETYAASWPDADAALAAMRREVHASIARLQALQRTGKKVALKFYDHLPFWKLVFTGEHVWVRSCHGVRHDTACPEYVFALQPEKPGRGFFPSFYTYFLNQWNDPRYPDYAFDTADLIYPDGKGGKPRRVPYPDADSGAGEPSGTAPARE